MAGFCTRLRTFAQIFLTDAALTAFDLQHKPTKHALRFKKPTSGPFKKKISTLYKNAFFFKKAIERF